MSEVKTETEVRKSPAVHLNCLMHFIIILLKKVFCGNTFTICNCDVARCCINVRLRWLSRCCLITELSDSSVKVNHSVSFCALALGKA